MNLLEPLTRLLPATLRRILIPSRSNSEQVQRLADLLQIDCADLASIRMGPRYHYRPFVIAKPDGRARRILAPSPALKHLQRRLLDGYLSTLPTHRCATAFRSGSSTIINARTHAYQKLVATVDLRDFFESTPANRVRRYFAKHGWRDDALSTLMRLCVHRNSLPQGAPTSPTLSNLVNLNLDEDLERLAKRHGGLYTRYGDDLTFSWDAERLPIGFQHAVEDRLHRLGYEIQPRKGWCVRAIHEQPIVTGLVLKGNGRLSIPWALRRKIWRMWFQNWWTGDADLIQSLHGYEAYARAVR